ncbi:unnamed protein product [Effrenium voratum]|nr:unnamed protein product [Effrenium voratum]
MQRMLGPILGFYFFLEVRCSPCQGGQIAEQKLCSSVRDSAACNEKYALINNKLVQCGWRQGNCLTTGPFCDKPPFTCSSTGASLEPVKNGIKVWDDRDYVLKDFDASGDMSGATYYRLAYHKSNWKDAVLTLKGVEGATVFLCSEPGGRTCGWESSLPNAGFQAVGTLVKWSLADFTCWKKTITTASYALPKISTDQCVQMLAVKCAQPPPPCSSTAVTVEPSKFFTGHTEPVKNGIKVWDDRDYVLKDFDANGDMSGATYYRLAYHKSNWKDAVLTLKGTAGATVFLCSEPGSGRTCGWESSLPNAGFQAVGKLVKWSLADFTCWKKTITTASYTLPKISTDQCVQMLAVKCGGVSLLSKRSLRKAHRLVA